MFKYIAHYFMSMFREITPKQVGKYVALVDGEIVASGATQLEVYQKAKRLHPQKLITLEYIPTKRETVTFL